MKATSNRLRGLATLILVAVLACLALPAAAGTTKPTSTQGGCNPLLEICGIPEYGVLEPEQGPVAFLLWRINDIPFEIGPVGTILPYEYDGQNALKVYLPGSNPSPNIETVAGAVYFLRGGQNNYATLRFPPDTFFLGDAGVLLETDYDDVAHTLTIYVP